MDFGDCIQLGMLFLAVFTIYKSQENIKKDHQILMFSEYTRRYQDIMLNMPDEIYSIREGFQDFHLSPKTKKWMQLYFDLCSEEFHLWQKGYIPKDVWKLWKEGMKDAMAKKEFASSWHIMNSYYNDKDFLSFFNHEIIKNENKRQTKEFRTNS